MRIRLYLLHGLILVSESSVSNGIHDPDKITQVCLVLKQGKPNSTLRKYLSCRYDNIQNRTYVVYKFFKHFEKEDRITLSNIYWKKTKLQSQKVQRLPVCSKMSTLSFKKYERNSWTLDIVVFNNLFKKSFSIYCSNR